MEGGVTPAPGRERFLALGREGYRSVPVVREVLADLETPLSAYLKLAGGPGSYLLESVQGGEKWGRYSVVGLPARHRLRYQEGRVRLEEALPEGGHRVLQEEATGDPLGWVDRWLGGRRVAPAEGLPLRFSGGLVGCFGYDLVRTLEPRLAGVAKPDPLGTPDLLLLVSEELVVYDNLRGRLLLVVHADPTAPGAWEGAVARLADLEARLRRPLGHPAPLRVERPAGEADWEQGFAREDFLSAVERIKRYIREGDVMQVVLSQRLSVPFRARPLDLYRALRGLNPSPYLYFLDFGDFQVAGSSPEILVRVEEGEVTVRPIAGTRPRGASEAEDLALAEELLADPKERAEHLMLIDLGRNDVGRVAQVGSVRVTERMVIERYSHVMHIVSNVTGRLRPGLSALDALRATFPAGTLTGAPKIRAMEIIDELEPVKRGLYGGAVGYLAWNGNLDTAIAIRTGVVKGGRLHVQAGAGVVADSVPEREWEETLNKARAVIRAAELAERGLEGP